MPRFPPSRQRHVPSVRHPRVATWACAALASLATLGVLPGAPTGAATASATPTFVRTIGSYGTGNGQFSTVGGIATDKNGAVYVTDVAGRVEVFDVNGAYLRQWGTQGSGDGQFTQPAGIAVDSHGAVYVADSFNSRIEVFDSAGTFLRKWGTSGLPTGVAIAPDGSVYVREDGSGSSSVVEVFSPAGALLSSFSGPASHNSYDGIAIDQSGLVYLSDATTGRIDKDTSAGVPVGTVGSPGTGNGQFTVTGGVAIGSGNLLYAIDNAGQSFTPVDRVEQFAASGAYSSQFDAVDLSVHPADLTAVGADCAGNIYAARLVYASPPTVQIDAYHDPSVPQSCGITVNDTGDTHDVTPGDGACADAAGKCTLRAAIEEVNAQVSASPVDVSFNIPGGGVPTITPGSALPPVTSPVNLDASTQPGTARERVLLGTRTGTLAFSGLDLQGTGSSVKGLIVAGFGGVGLKLEGAGGDQVTQSVLGGNDVGVEVDSPGVVLDGLGVATNGSAAGASSFEAATKGGNLTPAQAQGDLLALGAGIVVRSGAQNLTIRGSVIGGLNPADGPSPGPLNQSTGVLLAPGASAVSGVTIGDPASPNFFRGNSFGVVVAAPGAPVNALTVAGNNFGVEPGGGAPLAPVSNGIGILLSGNVNAAQIGAPGAKNTFIDSGVAIQALGTGIARLRVQFNLVGSDTGLADILSSPPGQLALNQHNLFGLILGDVSGATIGGPLGAQNAFIGDMTGVLMSGKHARLNTIEGNTFGRFSAPPGKANARAIGQYGMIDALVASEGGANQIGVAGLGNRFNDTVVGIHVAGEDQDIISANSVVDNLYGLLLNDVSQTSVGNASAASANTFQNNDIGTLQAHRELTSSEMAAAKLKPATADAAARAIPFMAPAAAGPLDLAGALSSAKVDPSAATLADQGIAASVYSARYGRNYIGTAAGGTARQGNYIGMLFAADVRRAIVGIGGGGPNLIEHNQAAGVAMFGVNGHAPQGVSLLGNAIYDNSNGPSPLFPGVKGLGIYLQNESPGARVLGPTPNDPGDTDTGPNGLQNYPLLTGVSQSRAGSLSYALALDSTPNQEFNVEVYSSPRCNPTGYGEGLHLLTARNVGTGQSGSGVASVEPVLSLGTVVPGVKVPRGDHWLTATATAPDGSTSEFSPCVKIATAPQPVGVLPTVTGVSATGITSVEVFNAGAYNVQEVQLEIAGSSSGAADISASAVRANRPLHMLATTRLVIRPHHARSVRLHLTRAALKLLIKRHRLTVIAVVRATKGKRHLTVTIRYIIYAPKRR